MADNAAISGGAVAKTRSLPVLTTVGNRQVISSGRWNDHVIADFIMANGNLRTLKVSDLAKVAYGHANKDTMAKARRYLHKIFTLLIDRGVLMVTEYDTSNGRALSVRLFDNRSENDRQLLLTKLDHMKRRKELSTERYDRAVVLISP